MAVYYFIYLKKTYPSKALNKYKTCEPLKILEHFLIILYYISDT
jgi:hypothetical protein